MSKEIDQYTEEHIKAKKSHRRGTEAQGAKTFRRGRAIAFYEKLIVRRDTLKKQLESKELQSIHHVIAGELKATEAIISEFIKAFGLDEISTEKND